MSLARVSLDDEYTLERGRIFASGLEVLVRLPLEQVRRDRLAGLDSAGLVSGYRSSPPRGPQEPQGGRRRLAAASKMPTGWAMQ